MKIQNLTEKSSIYTSNVYLITGTWNTLDDQNTLIDVGRDPSIIGMIRTASSGVGKHKLDQVILTHSHYDHASLLPEIREAFQPVVYAFSDYLKGVDRVLRGGEHLIAGDRSFEVIHTPGHSQDSICLYCEEDGALFAGDTPLVIRTPGGTYEEGFIDALKEICQKDVRTIYFGHGLPFIHDCNQMLRTSLRNVQGSHSK
ncbi:MAG: MBL fold metallo-hydrolase [Methanocalculus sp.]|uniref:MBL fold metallo-hydrolase n=1 Tax=Methanocalculus sp. TaxID=2004547 RepID=UPI00272750C1|nr:MBL fold metallo-hydrolase [Methanocalculus sp.]MDO9538415.1 MBL fold metallo-hydrolase [Methanocalculus sp.]